MNKHQNENIVRVSHVSENLLMECFLIANMSRPNNAMALHATMAREVNDCNHILFVYNRNNFIHGFIKGHFIQEDNDVPALARIDWLFVDTARHRRGIGAQLVAAYENYCIDMGITRIQVQPAPTVQAKTFYAKHKYLPCGMAYTHMKDLSR